MVFSFSKPTNPPTKRYERRCFASYHRDSILARVPSPFCDAHHRPKNTSSPHSHASRTFVRAHCLRHACLRRRLDRSMRRLYRHNGARAARRNWTRPRSRGATSFAAPRFASKATMGRRSRRGVRLSRKSSTRCVVIGVEIKWKCKWKWTRARRVGGIVAIRLTD
jgi:hypothetical protein